MLSHDKTAKLRTLVDQACGIVITNTGKHVQPLNFASVIIVRKESLSDTPKEVFAYAAGRPKLLYGNAASTAAAAAAADATDLVHFMASFTKPVTAIACMQLVEQGKLALDDADQVETLCPELRDVKYLADDGTLQEKAGRITLRMLLTHTGMSSHPTSSCKDAEMARRSKPALDTPSQTKSYVTRHGIETLQSRQPFRNSGINHLSTSQALISNMALDWAGFLVERATGLKLDEYMQRYIFEPLDIKDMSFFPAGEMKSRVLVMEQRLPGGHLAARDHAWKYALNVRAQDKPNTVRSGGAGLFGSPREYSKILAMLLNNGVSPKTGTRLLSSATVDDMFRNQLPDTPHFARQYVPAAEPELVYPSDGYYSLAAPPTPQGWGLSFMISPSVTGRSDRTAHWSGMSNMFWWCDREKAVAGIVASQILPFPDPAVGKLWARVEAAVYEPAGRL